MAAAAATATATATAGTKRKATESLAETEKRLRLAAEARMTAVCEAIAQRAEGKVTAPIDTIEAGFNYLTAEMEDMELELCNTRAENYDLKGEVQELKARLANRPAVAAAAAAAASSTASLWTADRVPFHHKANSTEIREWVRTQCGLSPYFTNKCDVTAIYELYDQKHDNAFSRKLNAAGKTLEFRWSGQLKTSAANCRRTCEGFIISFCDRVFFDEVDENAVCGMTCGGLSCTDRLTALLLTLEHELVHMLLFLDAKDPPAHGALFMNVVSNLFGHTACSHGLIHAQKRTADNALHAFAVGERVSFEVGKKSEGRKTVQGVVKCVTSTKLRVLLDDNRYARIPFKRATVVVVAPPAAAAAATT